MNGKELKARRKLIALLRMAYSSEMAAAYAYQGHADSVKNPQEKDKIRDIEREEWVHREKVGKILVELGSGPSGFREFVMSKIGKTLKVLCHVSGWWLPMFGAWRLEVMNVGEYEAAARYAEESGLAQFVPALREMTKVEMDHVIFFRNCLDRGKSSASAKN